jgi:hypothetical protein
VKMGVAGALKPCCLSMKMYGVALEDHNLLIK